MIQWFTKKEKLSQLFSFDGYFYGKWMWWTLFSSFQSFPFSSKCVKLNGKNIFEMKRTEISKKGFYSFYSIKGNEWSDSWKWMKNQKKGNKTLTRLFTTKQNKTKRTTTKRRLIFLVKWRKANMILFRINCHLCR